MAEKLEGTEVEFVPSEVEKKGRMVIVVDGEEVYKKGGFDAVNPQPVRHPSFRPCLQHPLRLTRKATE